MRAHGHTQIETSWGQGKGSPETFHLATGFVPTGEFEDGEVLARLTL